MKASFILTKKSNRKGNDNLHFDAGGSGKFFQIFTKFVGEKKSSEPAQDHSEFSDLLSKLVIEHNHDGVYDEESRIELDGEAKEIKELAAWAIGEIKADGDILINTLERLGSAAKDVVSIATNSEQLDKENRELKSKLDKLEKEAAETKK